MVAVRTYRVVVTREGKDWLADVPELEGTHTWARNLTSLDRAVREAIVLGADLPDDAMDDLELDYEFRTGDPVVDSESAEVRTWRRKLSETERQVERRTYGLVDKLGARGLSVRDVAVLVGLSPQRVSQIHHKKASVAAETAKSKR
ncbi:HicB family protein [Carbonactinospora thermoautotrophica]|nr:HicB family protein [Carbonactinospora thermoautotrophica]